MILGKKFDPENDNDYKRIVEVENKAVIMKNKIDEVSTEVPQTQ